MIIGITGTNGAGKGTVVEYLVQKKGFKHHSARAFLFEEIDRRGLPRDRNSTNLVGNDLRKKHGPAHIIETLYERGKDKEDHAVIESIRAVGEAAFLKSKGAKILVVDADRYKRYERVVLRGEVTDKVTFEEFCLQEDREMSSKDLWDMNIFGVMEHADAHLINNTTREDLYDQIDKALEKLHES